VPAQTRVHAWRVLSSALSWAARSPSVPEIQTNGCKLAREPVVSRRRSARTGGTGYTPVVRARPLPSWALSPQAVEAIRAQMLLCPAPRKAILAPRRDDREPAIRHGEPQPGALGTSLVLPRRRVRMGDGSPHQRAAPTMGQDRAQHPTLHRPTRHSARRPRAMAGDPHTIRTPCTRERLHHPGRPHQRPPWRTRGQDRRLSFQQVAGEALGSRMLHASGASRRAAPGVRTHPWRHPVCAAPRWHLAAPAHRRPTICRQRVRHQPENAQRPLLIPDRGPASTRATTSRCRVASRTCRTSESSFA
jgi:hypothetical protein